VNTFGKLSILTVAGLGLLAAACGGSQDAGSTTTGAAAAPAASSSSAPASSGYGYGSAPAASSAPAVAPSLVKAGTITVGGKPETVLADAKGLTLYYFTPDKGGRVTCTGGCAQAWPPLEVSGTAAPAVPSGLSGTLGTVQSPDGRLQLTFNGWPLYTYAGDAAPGDANGRGLNGKWFEVTSATPQA
jgi:predicted lipoprotein with Yx(FWY)xxD motif